jgi:hypothetical protein
MSEPKVFISYVQDDADWVQRFVEALREQHVQVWPDADPSAGDDAFIEAVEAGLRGSDAIVSVLTKEGARNPNVLVELGFAISTRKPLIPIVPADVERTRFPYTLRGRRYLTLGAPDEVAREVAEVVKGRAA